MSSQPFEVLNCGGGMDSGIIPVQNQSWDDNPDLFLFDIKIAMDLARDFLKRLKLMF
jgi:hypothetical protein